MIRRQSGTGELEAAPMLTAQDSMRTAGAASPRNGGGAQAQSTRPMSPAPKDPALPARTPSSHGRRGYLEIERDDEPLSVAGAPSAATGWSPLWVIAANNVVYMAAPLSLPATMAACGWVWGTLILGYSIVGTYHSGILLGEVIVAQPALDSYPKVCGEAAAVFCKRYLDWLVPEGMARRVGNELAVSLQFLAYFFDSTAQILYCAEYFDQLLPNSPVCQHQWLLIVWLLSIPLMQAPNFGESRASVLVALLCLMLNVATFLGEVISYAPWNCQPGPVYEEPNVARIFIGFTAFAYAFGGHGMYPEEVREMRNPRDWPKVMHWTYGVCVTMYVVCGYLGYFAYGTAARANLNSNFPPNTLNTVSIIVQLVVTYYCIYVTSLVMLLHVEQHAFGIDPRMSCGQTTMRTAAIRFVYRTLFVGLQVLLCWMLVGVSGDVLLTIQSFSGAIGMTALTYILPFVVHWILRPDKVRAWPMRVWYVVNIVLGIVIMIGGTVSGLSGMMESVFGGGDSQGELECHLQYMYAPQSPCDACYKGGLPAIYYEGLGPQNDTCYAYFDDDLLRR